MKNIKKTTWICLAFVLIILLQLFFKIFNFSATAAAANLQHPLIIIDAGHGGFDSGAVSGSYYEKDINLAISQTLADVFRFAGFPVILSREADCALNTDGETIAEKKRSDMRNRLKLIADNPGSIFLCIHQNAYKGQSVSGSQVFYYTENKNGKLLAECIQNAIIQQLQPNNKRQPKASKNEYFLLRKSKVPGVLIECGFMTEQQELENLKDPKYQQQLAICIYNGVCEFLNNQTTNNPIQKEDL